MDAAIEKADGLERDRGGLAVARHGLFIVLRPGGHVQMEADAELVGDLDFRPEQRFGVVDIGRVRPEPGNDPAIGGTLLFEKGPGARQLLDAALLVAQLHDAIGNDGAQPGVLDRSSDLPGEEILVAEGGGAREQHLGAAQRHGGTDIGGDQRELRLADRIVPAFHCEQALPPRSGRETAPITEWVWALTMPGISSWPVRSITSSKPLKEGVVSLEPTESILPSRTETHPPASTVSPRSTVSNRRRGKAKTPYHPI